MIILLLLVIGIAVMVNHELKVPSEERWWWPRPRMGRGRGSRSAPPDEIDLYNLPPSDAVPEEPDTIETGDDDRGRLIRLLLDYLDRDFAENQPTAFSMHLEEVYRLEGNPSTIPFDLRSLRRHVVRYVDRLYEIAGPGGSDRLVRAVENNIRHLRWFELTAESRKDLSDCMIMQRVLAVANTLTHGKSLAIRANMLKTKLDLDNINNDIINLSKGRMWESVKARKMERDKILEQYESAAASMRSGRFDPYRVPRSRSVDTVVVYLATFHAAVALRRGDRSIDDNEIMRRIVDGVTAH